MRGGCLSLLAESASRRLSACSRTQGICCELGSSASVSFVCARLRSDSCSEVGGLRRSQNCSIDVEATQKGPVLCLDVVGEDLDGEVAHAHLSIEVLELALDHDVERLEQQGVEVGLHFLFALVLLKLLELLGFHTCLPNKQRRLANSNLDSCGASGPLLGCETYP